MNKREAKQEACWIAHQEIEYFLEVGGQSAYEDPSKVETALMELKAELLRRAGSAAVYEVYELEKTR